MEVKVCKNCRRLFNHLVGPELCPECYKLALENKVDPNNTMSSSNLKPKVLENEEKFEKVKDYIMMNSKATVAQIAEANDIVPSKLLEWVRDDRLEFSDESSQVWFTCERCGTKIRSGRLCVRCRVK